MGQGCGHEKSHGSAAGGFRSGQRSFCKAGIAEIVFPVPELNHVNVDIATYTNAIGDSELMASWTDPDFDASESAFYYVRVLEKPTPRWRTYDVAFYNIDRPDNVPAQIQDRA